MPFDPNTAMMPPRESSATSTGWLVVRGPSTGSFEGFDHPVPSDDHVYQTP
jgi:hypothetical protein